MTGDTPSTGPLARRARYHSKRRAEGWRQVTIWLRPEAVAKLGRLSPHHGSQDAAINAAILAMEPPPMRLGQRVTWKGRAGVVREIGGLGVNIRFDDASDDAPEWRAGGSVEPLD